MTAAEATSLVRQTKHGHFHHVKDHRQSCISKNTRYSIRDRHAWVMLADGHCPSVESSTGMGFEHPAEEYGDVTCIEQEGEGKRNRPESRR